MKRSSKMTKWHERWNTLCGAVKRRFQQPALKFCFPLYGLPYTYVNYDLDLDVLYAPDNVVYSAISCQHLSFVIMTNRLLLASLNVTTSTSVGPVQCNAFVDVPGSTSDGNVISFRLRWYFVQASLPCHLPSYIYAFVAVTWEI